MNVRSALLGLIIASQLHLTSALAQSPEQNQNGLLFRLSADQTLTADQAGGLDQPTFADKVAIVPTGGARGGYVRAEDDQVLAWDAPGNILAQRGTLAFFWRSRTPIGTNPFPIFRVSFANHSSWDMVFLRIDWNGEGFDAFVTDTNLARVRLSWTAPSPPAAESWTHIAFAWDETAGVQLYVDGQPVARRDQAALLDAGLDQFGPHSRIISPMQVQSRYNFLRGGDLDELHIFDHVLPARDIATLARLGEPISRTSEPDGRAIWARRLGFEERSPPYLEQASTSVRRLEFTDQRDVAQRMWKGNDGIRETTWPGVYNRSGLQGRLDYFVLPDWNVYSEGGRTGTWYLPPEPWNHVEIQGAAYGRLLAQTAETPDVATSPATLPGQLLMIRPRGLERSTLRLEHELQGGSVSFVNDTPETPIQEIGIYRVSPGQAPEGIGRFDLVVRSEVEVDFPATESLRSWIAGRYPVAERSSVAALPPGAATRRRTEDAHPNARPLVHILIPQDLRRQPPGLALSRGANFGFENFGGLDGLELRLPAMDLAGDASGFIPLNIRIKDPIAPERDLLDINVSVKPGESRTLWLDTRDRILPPDRPLYLTLASSAVRFGPAHIDGMRIGLVFKSRHSARIEHELDRFHQIRDNYGFLVEERQTTRNLRLFQRFYEDLSDLLRVNPDHPGGLAYWSEWNPQQPLPPIDIEPSPAHTPAWAWGQTKALEQAGSFINWWIDNRQIDGEFGGGLSDDTDLTNQWPGVALMGVSPDKIRSSLSRLIEATYRNGMWRNGLGAIVTDELHVYEEGVNAISQLSYLAPDDPQNIERLMQTAARYSDLTEINPAGNRLFVSNYYGGDLIVRQDPWQWSKPYSYLILHPGIRLVDYNGSPTLKALLLDLADGYLAHATVDTRGDRIYPTEINWPDGATRGSGGPQQTNLLMWAAYRWTGDERYLGPIEQVIRQGGPRALTGIINGDLGLELVRPDLNTGWVEAADDRRPSSIALHGAWAATGNKAYLVRLYDQLRQSAALRMSMMTEDHWWTDRVEIPTQELQRQRLGGVALSRNAIVQGNLISWRFSDESDATKLAVLVIDPRPTHFRIVAHNLSDGPIEAAVIGAQIASGRWTVDQGLDDNGDDRAETATTRSSHAFSSGASLAFRFMPGATTILDFSLESPEPDIRERVDLGLSDHGITRTADTIAVTVHALGSRDSDEATLLLETLDGLILAQSVIPPLAAPNDLQPSRAVVQIRAPDVHYPEGLRLRIRYTQPEISTDNNTLVLPSGLQ
jgi:hypothetical protein